MLCCCSYSQQLGVHVCCYCYDGCCYCCCLPRLSSLAAPIPSIQSVQPCCRPPCSSFACPTTRSQPLAVQALSNPQPTSSKTGGGGCAMALCEPKKLCDNVSPATVLRFHDSNLCVRFFSQNLGDEVAGSPYRWRQPDTHNTSQGPPGQSARAHPGHIIEQVIGCRRRRRITPEDYFLATLECVRLCQVLTCTIRLGLGPCKPYFGPHSEDPDGPDLTSGHLFTPAPLPLVSSLRFCLFSHRKQY